MSAGMIPAFDRPGLISPGQFGPMMRVPRPCAYAQNQVVSCTGMPSVITTQSGMPASMASTTAPLANRGGTNTTVTSAPVSAIASGTELKTGSVVASNSTFCPPLPGVTPPTTLVPARSIRRVCLLPSEPVMPWTMTLLFSVSQIAMSAPLRGKLGGPVGRTVHRVHLFQVRQRRLGEDAAADLGVVAVQPDDQRVV